MLTSAGTSGSCWPRSGGSMWHWLRMPSTSRRGPWAPRRERRSAMSDSRISVLILAKNEAENLPSCLATVDWANEVIVVVDRASRDQTQLIAQRRADLV